MGNCSLHTDNDDPTLTMTRNQFLFRYPIGRGGFSKVWRVRYRVSKEEFALKEMSKDRIIAKKSVASVVNELRLLASLRHQFLVNMLFAFQDSTNLYLVLNLMPGGDLRYHIGRFRRFAEAQTRFFVCCIILALEYLHSNGIIHRDVKPENIVLDSCGYAHLTDFGIARMLADDNSSDTSGTPGYMAPEVMCKMRHGMEVDYFALGVVTYEFMTGRRPYPGRTRKEIRDTILAKQVSLEEKDIPSGYDPSIADFISRLLQRKPSLRLGHNGDEEVKSHPWLRSVNWSHLSFRQLDSPFLPGSGDNFDHKFANEEWKDEEQLRAIRLADSMKQGLFSGYSFNGLSQTQTGEVKEIQCKEGE